MKHLIRILFLLIAFGSLGLAQRATQQNFIGPWYMQDYEEKWWRFELGLGFEVEPTYPGSKETEEEIGGFIRGVFKDKWNNRYFITPDGVSGAFDITEDLTFVGEIEVEEGDEGESADLDGLDKIDDTVEGEFTLAKRWGEAYAFGAVQPDLLGRGKGLVYFLGGGYDWQPTERFGWRNILVLSGGDDEHMDTEFDITAEEAERTGYREYDPGAGLKTLAWQSQAEYKLNEKFSLFANMDVEHYIGDGADSPLVKDIGTDITTEALAGLLFRW